ncbi:MAG: T9SS type A sorting domain-containing protein [Acidobacteriota bacterium]
MTRLTRHVSMMLLCAVLAYHPPARAQFDLMNARPADKLAASKFFMVGSTAVSTFETTNLSLPVATSTSGILHVESTHKTTAVQEVTAVPQSFELSQNFPNPFNMSTQIRYSVPVASTVSLVVYDLMGREVAVLVNGPVAAGMHAASFGTNALASGTYYYRMIASSPSGVSMAATKKMIVMK